MNRKIGENRKIALNDIHWVQKRSEHSGFQFSDFKLKSFVDP